MKRYNFDRFRGNLLLAEGIGVHAENIDSAMEKALKIKGDDPALLKFRDNEPCPPGAHCRICDNNNP